MENFTEKLFDLENLPTRGKKRRATHWKVFRVLRSVEGETVVGNPGFLRGKGFELDFKGNEQIIIWNGIMYY